MESIDVGSRIILVSETADNCDLPIGSLGTVLYSKYDRGHENTLGMYDYVVEFDDEFPRGHECRPVGTSEKYGTKNHGWFCKSDWIEPATQDEKEFVFDENELNDLM